MQIPFPQSSAQAPRTDGLEVRGYRYNCRNAFDEEEPLHIKMGHRISRLSRTRDAREVKQERIAKV
jgi:hypothetical protein